MLSVPFAEKVTPFCGNSENLARYAPSLRNRLFSRLKRAVAGQKTVPSWSSATSLKKQERLGDVVVT